MPCATPQAMAVALARLMTPRASRSAASPMRALSVAIVAIARPSVSA
jgi:hypothetical protein